MTVGWYVHHHGRGHLTRAAAIRPHVGADVTVLSSLPAPPGSRPGWVRLDRDDEGPAGLDAAAANPAVANPAVASPAPTDPTGHGRLHWVPLGDAGLRGRMGQIAAWIVEHRPTVMVVDVSVEVTLLARLFGIPVVVFAGPGERGDAAHQLAYGVAERIIAPWPQAVYDPAFLHPYAGKTHYVGAISRFDGWTAPDPTRPAAGPGEQGRGEQGRGEQGRGADGDVVVLAGAGGNAITGADLAGARSSVPTRRWTGLGLTRSGWAEDVWPRLAAAGVVVTHGGQNAVAEVAAARRPSVVIPQDRPFAEQAHLASALHRHGIAVTAPTWPAAAEWPRLIDSALRLGGERWAHWSSGHGAEDAAAVVTAACST